MALLDAIRRPGGDYGFAFLFVSLILMISVPVFLPPGPVEFGVPILFTVLAITALGAVADSRRTVIIGLALAVPAVLLSWVGGATRHLAADLAGDLLAIVFLAFLTGVLLTHVLRSRVVTSDMLFALACVYLLIAFMWSLSYGVTEALDPGALSLPQPKDVALGGPSAGRGYLTYFSFVTLTTLGYGDVTPVSDIARVLAMLEATLGQLFLVFVVARLVGLHTAQHVSRAEPHRS